MNNTGDLLKAFPIVRRARDYRLYAPDGRRYLDMYLDDGLALCGYRPVNFTRAVKNTLSRGLSAAYHGVYERRFYKALAEMYPEYAVFRLYLSEAKILAQPEMSPERWRCLQAAPFRPFLPWETDESPVLLNLPLQIRPAPYVFAFDSSCVWSDSDCISPFLFNALLENFRSLRMMAESYIETRWRQWESPGWQRQGPYLYPDCSAVEYQARFFRYRDAGFLLNPRFPGPSIIPAEHTENELQRFLQMKGALSC